MPEYTCSTVTEGQIYEFRVKAVNDAGAGQPSKPSVAQKAEPPISMQNIIIFIKCKWKFLVLKIFSCIIDNWSAKSRSCW